MGKSNLHSHLQDKGFEYLANKGYWVRTQEMPTSVGIIDVWGIKNRSYDTMAIEVKVSRNDYCSRSQKYKEFSSKNIANYCYILCPEGLIKEVRHKNWGLLWYSEKTGRLRLIKKAERFEMLEKSKLHIMLHLFHSRINNPDKLLRYDKLALLQEK